MANMIVSSLFSLFGLAYFVYGKKASEPDFMLAGVALMIYPYFIGNVWLMAGIGLTLTVAPFAWRRWGGG
jgi:hypothetical protein